MRLQLRESWRNCPRDGKKLAIFPIEDEGKKTVTHRCLSCDWSERAPGERPQKTASPYMAEIRRKAWGE